MQMRAKVNQVFVCQSCGKLFMDRKATEPVEISIAITHDMEMIPDAPVKATEDVTDTKKKATRGVTRGMNTRASIVSRDGAADVTTADIPARPAGDCCAAHTKLCDSGSLKVAKMGDDVHIIAAKRLE